MQTIDIRHDEFESLIMDLDEHEQFFLTGNGLLATGYFDDEGFFRLICCENYTEEQIQYDIDVAIGAELEPDDGYDDF